MISSVQRVVTEITAVILEPAHTVVVYAFSKVLFLCHIIVKIQLYHDVAKPNLAWLTQESVQEVDANTTAET